ncbi:MAG: fatty acid desaturase family protein [Flavobacteriales bacterium]|nr:fatty acid desaturase family protein [Flavobacteriales bacterium]
MKSKLATSEYRSLKQIDSKKGVFLLLGDWTLIVAAVVVCVNFDLWFLYLLSVIVIGSRMMGLWALLHDGHHNMLVRSKRLNRMLTEWFIAWPLFKSLDEFDEQHSAHHRFLGGNGDPNFALTRYAEFQFPMSKTRLASILVKDLLGINFIYYRLLGLIKDPMVLLKKTSNWSVQRAVYYVLLAVLITYFQLWLAVLLFWVLPLVTYFQFLIRVTLISDHCFATSDTRLARSVQLSWVEQFLLVPHNLNYHYEHHHYGGIPCYNLKQLHLKLALSPGYFDDSDFSRGYLDVFRKVTLGS